MTIGNHQDLIVWQKAMDLVMKTYQLSKTFPHDELYTLTSQMRRAAISIPSNIAEGRRRHSEPEFKRFLRIAFGSAAELETQIEIADRLGYGKKEHYEEAKELVVEVLRMLNVMTA